VLRVSGKIRDFKSEGPERMYYRKKGKYITIDLAIPRKAWEGNSLSRVRRQLALGLLATFAGLKERLLEIDENVKIKKWERDFSKCINKFEEEDGKFEVRKND
jgi:hypothetical protein